MFVYYLDEDLREFFHDYSHIDPNAENYKDLEEEFVVEVLDEDVEEPEISYESDEPYKVVNLLNNTATTPNLIVDETMYKSAAVIFGERYIKLWDLVRDLIIELCIDGGVDWLIFPDSMKVSILVSLIKFARTLSKYITPLSKGKKAFCKYVMVNHYTVSDWVCNPPDGGCGFLLSRAIDKYCEYMLNENPSMDAAKVRKETQQYADELIAEGVFVKRDETGRYIIRF